MAKKKDIDKVVAAALDEGWQVKDRNVILLLPIYKHPSPDTMITLMMAYAKYGPEKIGMIMEKNTVIHEARNILWHKFMTTTKGAVGIMLDDDMIVPCGSEGLLNGNYRANLPPEMAALNFFDRILSHGLDKHIVGCLYWGRHALGRPQNNLGFDNGWERHADAFRNREHKGLVPVSWVGTGGIRITRTCGDALNRAIESGQFPECKMDNGMWSGPFTPLKTGIGEDVSFGIRAAKLGIQSYVDAGLECLHTGTCHYGAHNTRNT